MASELSNRPLGATGQGRRRYLRKRGFESTARRNGTGRKDVCAANQKEAEAANCTTRRARSGRIEFSPKQAARGREERYGDLARRQIEKGKRADLSSERLVEGAAGEVRGEAEGAGDGGWPRRGRHGGTRHDRRFLRGWAAPGRRKRRGRCDGMRRGRGGVEAKRRKGNGRGGVKAS
jgi:hypothetical protein